MARNIVLCFDGTWNRPEDTTDRESTKNTNVFRIFDSVRNAAPGGRTQLKWYNEGVGTEWWNRIGGGAFGLALDDHILAGYRQLISTFEDGDDVYLFGFSRGAYTARSLVGLVRKAGLLNEPDPVLVDQAYTMYRTRDEDADSEAARDFRARHSREIQIHCVGVWDTVGALGVPLQSFGDFNQAFYKFHDTKLSGIVRNAFHAVAIDEHRQPYAPTLWGPKTVKDESQRLEQSWFTGAHADIGGGYADQPLSDITLRWMQAKSGECGLGLDPFPVPATATAKEYLANVTDSFKQFLDGIYAMLHTRFYRPMGVVVDGPQMLDATVMARVKERADYRPKNPGFFDLLKQLV